MVAETACSVTLMDRHKGGFRALRGIALGLCLLSLAGCAMGGSIEKAVPDHSAITGAIASGDAKQLPDTSTASDQSTIKNVISALNFTQWGKKPIPWANPDTGSQGAITTVAETSANDQLCRKFQTSREAFDGVALYRGEACMQRGGEWTLTSFAPL